MPLISANGRLMTPLLIVMKEKDGKFGPIVTKNMFRHPNIYIVASASGAEKKYFIG
ncbi:hypothetical protein B4U80_02605 [Leptotrombidium deliense]|uniref:Uncharacterized protein n=1 Tax=Leptotrombidium deliense TaxID=299467 RepID=A0A443QA53_9ACAR|nr:hypothetical protein B4U80_02605 [Leptotrombidium deliense]